MTIVFIVLLKKINLEKAILALGISLSTIFLIFFGAYETTRLYLHMILAGWLILYAYGDHILGSKIGEKIAYVGNSIFTYLLIGILFIFWSINSFNYRMEITDSVSNFLDGREVQVNWVVGSSGPEQYRKILDSKLGLWAKDSHIWGIYYGIENFHRGELGYNNQDLKYILNKILSQNIGWVYSNEEKDFEEISKIQDYCTGSFNKIDTSKNMYKQILYQLDLKQIHSCIAANKIP
jgi:hypothetical protein